MFGLGLLGKLFLKVIGGTRNERIVRACMRVVREQINPLEAELQGLSDEALRARSDALRKRRAGGDSREAILPEAFALVRESCRRARLDWERDKALPAEVLLARHWGAVAPRGELQDLNVHRQYDVQLVAGMILDRGWVAEEATGEGKTIACYPALYMAVLEGMHAHVVTVNDYLVARDALSASQAFWRLGVTVGYITAEMENEDRQPMYARDITYGTNSEFGFDYLRDNMKLAVEDQVQGPLDFAIIDEVDSILIDEARTPLIISGPARGQVDSYREAAAVTEQLVRLEEQRKREEGRVEGRIESLRAWVERLDGAVQSGRGGQCRDALRQIVASAGGEQLKGFLQKQIEDADDTALEGALRGLLGAGRGASDRLRARERALARVIEIGRDDQRRQALGEQIDQADDLAEFLRQVSAGAPDDKLAAHLRGALKGARQAADKHEQRFERLERATQAGAGDQRRRALGELVDEIKEDDLRAALDDVLERLEDDSLGACARAASAECRDELNEAERKLLPYYETQLDKKSAYLTHEGTSVAQEIAEKRFGVRGFYTGANLEWPHLMEQSLRAHLVYKKGKEYVVQNGRVVIVDEFTGRLLEGREWSDGLHQAVEAKESVEVKQENQTLATITLQNFFKLYKKLAGMTGTAMTEATELMKIYDLDVVSVPTHRPVNRMDHDDRIYADEPAKYRALVEEINAVSKVGRPVLVGTTSVEKSEALSQMLQKKYGVEHEVLNARPENASRESYIVAQAGYQRPIKKGAKKMVGNVTIATNMAGRGTDIKLGPGVVYPKCRVPSDEEIRRLGLEPDPLYPAGVNKCCILCGQHDPATNCAHCFKPKLDSSFPLRGRTDCRDEVPCGLHIVGTERHEARRIDNQLRGRSGRQGDPGSSRFFLSLHDDLISIFAGDWMRKVLGWLGLKGDVAIEDRRVSRGISRAQRKVEERNFEARKNLLEYDEVMDYQRRIFYEQRQKILEGRELEGLVGEMIRQRIGDAVDDYLAGDYARTCLAEWARQKLQAPIRDDQIRAESLEDLPQLEETLRSLAKEETRNSIAMNIGEYAVGGEEDADEYLSPRNWDLSGLSRWAMSRYKVNLSQGVLRKMKPREVEEALAEAACGQIDELDLSGASEYLQPDFPRQSLARWMRAKFAIEVDPGELDAPTEEVEAALVARVEQAYERREIEAPVEYILTKTIGEAGPDNVYALGSLSDWIKRKFDEELPVDELRRMSPEEIHSHLVRVSESWMVGGRLESVVDGELKRWHAEADGGGESERARRTVLARAIRFSRRRFNTGTSLRAESFDSDVAGTLVSVGRQFLRREMRARERAVLLQIYDSAWKDHLLAMDHLKSGIGLRGFAEQDPRVAYKREGARLFQEMLDGVRDRIPEGIFKAEATSEEELVSVWEISDMMHEILQGYDHLAQDMADQQAAAQPQKVQTIVRDRPKVGRNDPCPCGSGKKYKKCCGRAV